MIVIVDYGIGNVGSIQNMLRKFGADAQLTSDLATIRNAEKIILPGVGHFDIGMAKLKEYNLIDTLNERVQKAGVPLLGICLGMQLMTRSSEEGQDSGLCWVDAETKKFQIDPAIKLRVPHMGWNKVSTLKDPTLFKGIDLDEARFYFVHSYYVQCINQNQIGGQTDYGFEFDSVVRNENVFGVQFHPEKSHKYGMQVLKNFVDFAS
jgi:imidazole glycerol-phosphate synthase subunit HisH